MVSIASAPGWKARFLAGDEQDESRIIALVSWALVEGADDTTEVVGVVQRAGTAEKPNGWLGFADEVEGFQGYTFTGPAAPDN
jgi:hypothetical protein